MDSAAVLRYNNRIRTKSNCWEEYDLKDLRRGFERFCLRHRDQGIRNLMLWVAVGNVILYGLSRIDPSGAVVNALSFNGSAILHGQIWRLFTFVFVPDYAISNAIDALLTFVMFFFYYQIGRILESRWGVFRFNLYYLAGVLLADVGALVLGVTATSVYLNLSLILAFATICPEDRILLMFIIPLKMKWLAWFYFAVTIFDVVRTAFPYNLLPLFALLNYFLFFGSDIKNVLPDALRNRRRRSPSGFKKAAPPAHGRPGPNWAVGYQNTNGQKPYHHKCTVCGRTDTDYPDLEFRYCSKCKGYYCYCMDHINNHAHIQ